MEDIRVIVEVEGGVVQRIVTNNKHLSCDVLDLDDFDNGIESAEYVALKAETEKLSKTGHSIYL